MPTNITATEFHLSDNFDDFGSRLRWARKRARMTQEQVCTAVGMSQGAYSTLERSGGGSEKTASLARALTVDPVWLESGQGEPEVKTYEAEDYVSVRRVGFNINATVNGVSIELIDEDGLPIWFLKSWLEENGFAADKLLAAQVRGSSMEKTLFDGDLVVVNLASREPKDGKVFAVNYEGEPIIKRLVRDSGAWWLDSDNPDKARFPRKLVTEDTTIVGEVIHRQSVVI